MGDSIGFTNRLGCPLNCVLANVWQEKGGGTDETEIRRIQNTLSDGYNDNRLSDRGQVSASLGICGQRDDVSLILKP